MIKLLNKSLKRKLKEIKTQKIAKSFQLLGQYGVDDKIFKVRKIAKMNFVKIVNPGLKKFKKPVVANASIADYES